MKTMYSGLGQGPGGKSRVAVKLPKSVRFKTAAITVVSVAGALLSSAPAHAACPNSNWQIHGPVTIVHSDGVTVKINQWDGIYADTDAGAQLFLADGTPAYLNSDGYPIGHYRYTPGNNAPYDAPSQETGRPYGGIPPNGTQFDMTITWDGLNNRAGSNRYIGTVDENGYASGNDTNSQNHITTQWHFTQNFVCTP